MITLQNEARLIEIRKTNGGHIRANFDRGPALFISSTPSDVRSIKNTAAMARRALRDALGRRGRRPMTQNDLFGATSTNPIVGLAARLSDRPCRSCGSIDVTIESTSKGPHHGSLRC